MKTPASKLTLIISALAVGSGLIAGVAMAQSDNASPNVPADPGILAQYDTNHNGRLDPDEVEQLRNDKQSGGKKHKGKKGKKGKKK
jgi:hypothetical protein